MQVKKEWIHPHVLRKLELIEGVLNPSRSWDIFVLASAAMVTFITLVAISALTIEVPTHIVGFVTGLAVFILLGSLILHWMRRDTDDDLPQKLKQLTVTVPLSAGEQSYIQLVLAMTEVDTLSEQAAHDMLSQANILLDHLVRLDEYRQRLQEIVGTTSEIDLHRLQERLRETTDAVARNALQQSLQILRERLQQRKRVEAHMQRTTALQELILQIFGSLRESLLQLKAIPAQAEEVDVGSLYQHLSEVQNETRAIEQALQELQEMEQ